MRAVDLIVKKRDGGHLDPAEMAWLVRGFTSGEVPDYQMSAFCMAVLFRGLDRIETKTMLETMVASGDQVTWEDLAQPTADKHSTGGVGDKISIPLAPAVAACGVAVPMISGRGLGHTGGTLDKLESIPGFDVRLDATAFKRITAEIGLCLIGQTERLVPADRKLYALRDVTGTVPNVQLIACSILSKKIAEGVGALVLDVKVGRGAFMRTPLDALDLSRTMVTLAGEVGRKATAWLSWMNAPTGTHVGNALEILESVRVLRGESRGETRAISVALGAEMLRLAGVATSHTDGARRMDEALDSGRALELFRRLVRAQGGDPRVCDDPEGTLPRAPVVRAVRAPRSGTLVTLDALDIGLAAVRLGAGRSKASDHVDSSVGFVVEMPRGSAVREGDVLGLVHASNDASAEAGARDYLAACDISDGPAPSDPALPRLSTQPDGLVTIDPFAPIAEHP